MSATLRQIALGESPVARGKAWSAVRAVITVGATAAALDLCYVFTFYGLRNGTSPIRILQSIATGAFGTEAYAGGLATALFGLVAHFFILIVAAWFYYLASIRLSALRLHAFTYGPLYGLAIYAFMNFVVLPLSASPLAHVPFTLSLAQVTNFLMHPVFGLIIALCVRRHWLSHRPA